MAHEAVRKPYATYDWYADQYGGMILSEEEFYRNARWATEMIDTMTFGNIKSEEMVIDRVRDATCAVAELARNYYESTVGADGGRGVKSESNDGYSVSYDESMSSMESLQCECRATIRMYLGNTGLLFRGTVVPRRCRHGKRS